MDKGMMEGSEELIHVHREIVKEAVQDAVVAVQARTGGTAIVQGASPSVRRVGGRKTADGYRQTWRFGDKLNGEKKLGN